MFRVQCFRWQAIKVQCFCVQRNMNAFVPPRPCPRLCSRCSASDDRRSRCSAFVCRGTWTLLSPPRPCQDYVQGAVLLMTGDQGAVLLCAGEHERFCPPPPLPRLCSRCSASDDRRSRCSAFVCRGTWTLLSPPPPLPRLCSRCSASDDRRSRCSAFVCRGTWTLLSPPRPCQDYVQGAVLLMTGDQGAVLLCAEEHERFCLPPPPPNQTLSGWVKWCFKSMDPTLVPSINDAFVPPTPPAKA